MKKNYSLFGLPEDVKFCKKCTISNQRPRSTVEFKNQNQNKEGININKNTPLCEACEYVESKKKIDWAERESKLINIEKKMDTTVLFQGVVEKTVHMLHIY